MRFNRFLHLIAFSGKAHRGSPASGGVTTKMLDAGAPSQAKRTPDFGRYLPLSGGGSGGWSISIMADFSLSEFRSKRSQEMNSFSGRKGAMDGALCSFSGGAGGPGSSVSHGCRTGPVWHGWSSFPSRETICQRSGIADPGNVTRAVNELVSKGFLARRKRTSSRRCYSDNLYVWPYAVRSLARTIPPWRRWRLPFLPFMRVLIRMPGVSLASSTTFLPLP